MEPKEKIKSLRQKKGDQLCRTLDQKSIIVVQTRIKSAEFWSNAFCFAPYSDMGTVSEMDKLSGIYSVFSGAQSWSHYFRPQHKIETDKPSGLYPVFSEGPRLSHFCFSIMFIIQRFEWFSGPLWLIAVKNFSLLQVLI